MNEELKATLEWLKECGENDYLFETGNSKMLLDYINNLQQRIEYLERSNNRREDTIMGLRDEIVEYDDYKSRKEKAVEYIKEHQRKDEFLNLNEWQSRELLNILNGDKSE